MCNSFLIGFGVNMAETMTVTHTYVHGYNYPEMVIHG